MNKNPPEKAVYLGRFAPFHKGHAETLDAIVENNGVEKTLVIIGSSDSLNPRTPFTFLQRKAIINMLYPQVEVIPFPDVQSELVIFDGSTNDIWLESLKKIEEGRGEKFTFYGGSDEDLAVLSDAFETHILIDRHNTDLQISATTVRAVLDDGDDEQLAKYVDSAVLPLIRACYEKYKSGSTLVKVRPVRG